MKNKEIWQWSIGIFVVALLIRLLVAAMQVSAGTSDSAYYYHLAENIYSGRGYVIDYIWHYFIIPDSITHIDNTFWMPLTSSVIALFFTLFGHHLFVALLPGAIASAFFPVIAFLFSIKVLNNKRIAFFSAAILLVHKWAVYPALRPDTTGIGNLFAALTLFFIVFSFKKSKNLLWAALFLGLAYLSRSDSSLLVVTLVLSWAFAFFMNGRSNIQRIPFRYLVLSGIIILIVMSPWFIFNLKHGYSMMPNSESHHKALFIQQYTDVYAYDKDLSFNSLAEWGLYNNIKARMGATVQNALFYLTRHLQILALFILLAVPLWIRRKEHWPVLFHFAFYFCVSSILFWAQSTAGSFTHTSPMFLMFMIPYGVYGLIEGARLSQKRWPRIKRESMTVILVVLILVMNCAYTLQGVNTKIKQDENVLDTFANIKGFAEQKNLTGNIFMVRDIYHFNLYTGIRAVQVPNDDIETMFMVAGLYNVTHVIPNRTVPYLEDIQNDSRLKKVYEYGSLVIYEIVG